jgi:hypothetical protein
MRSADVSLRANGGSAGIVAVRGGYRRRHHTDRDTYRGERDQGSDDEAHHSIMRPVQEVAPAAAQSEATVSDRQGRS